MRARSFSHVGITVSNFSMAVQFYWDVFGCPLVGVADTPPERVRSFFKVDAPAQPEAAHGHTAAGGTAVGGTALGDAPRCKIGWIRVPGGATLEIFEFHPQLPPEAGPWNRVGLTHFCFDVRNTDRWYAHLQRKGVECLTRPERSPRGHTFFFCRDFDGNLIELIDLGRMYHVLKWLGPLGGWLFRRGMYKEYYGPRRS